jgi:hypothetical protein
MAEAVGGFQRTGGDHLGNDRQAQAKPCVHRIRST